MRGLQGFCAAVQGVCHVTERNFTILVGKRVVGASRGLRIDCVISGMFYCKNGNVYIRYVWWYDIMDGDEVWSMMRGLGKRISNEDKFARKWYCNTERFVWKMKRGCRRKERRLLNKILWMGEI